MSKEQNTLHDLYDEYKDKQKAEGLPTYTNEFGHYILKFILDNSYAIQRRNNLDSDRWVNCDFRSLVSGILSFKYEPFKETPQWIGNAVFDTHNFHFYRIRPNEAPRQDKYLKITDQIDQVKER